MLVLSRTQGTAITLDDDIEIEVIAIQGNQVKLGIRAPQEIEILRSELRTIPDFHPDDIIIRAPRVLTETEWID